MEPPRSANRTQFRSKRVCELCGTNDHSFIFFIEDDRWNFCAQCDMPDFSEYKKDRG